MGRLRVCAFLVAVAVLVIGEAPAHAVSRTATAVAQGSGTISPNPFQPGAHSLNIDGTAVGVFDDLPGMCTLSVSAPVAGRYRLAGTSGALNCNGISPLGSFISISCSIFLIEIDVVTGQILGDCGGTARGPLVLTMLMLPTTTTAESFSFIGTLVVGASA